MEEINNLTSARAIESTFDAIAASPSTALLVRTSVAAENDEVTIVSPETKKELDDSHNILPIEVTLSAPLMIGELRLNRQENEEYNYNNGSSSSADNNERTSWHVTGNNSARLASKELPQTYGKLPLIHSYIYNDTICTSAPISPPPKGLDHTYPKMSERFYD